MYPLLNFLHGSESSLENHGMSALEETANSGPTSLVIGRLSNLPKVTKQMNYKTKSGCPSSLLFPLHHTGSHSALRLHRVTNTLKGNVINQHLDTRHQTQPLVENRIPN